MSAKRVNQQSAFIVHTRPYTETSLIVEVFSHDYGRLGLLSKGARNPKNHKRGILQPFQPLLLNWIGKGELPILSSVEQGKNLLYFDYKSRVCGFYINELIFKLLQRRDPHPELYVAYSELMQTLNDCSLKNKERELALRLFEKKLLTEIGYGLILDRDVDQGELINPELVYRYVPERGPEVYRSDIHKTASSTASSPLIVSGMVLHCIDRNQYPSEQIMQQAKQFMRYILQTLLDGKIIYSRRLLYIS